MIDTSGYILDTQKTLIRWAKAYEEGERIPLVSDRIYDMTVRQLIQMREMYREEWESVSLPVFTRDESWTYTGSFYR